MSSVIFEQSLFDRMVDILAICDDELLPKSLYEAMRAFRSEDSPVTRYSLSWTGKCPDKNVDIRLAHHRRGVYVEISKVWLRHICSILNYTADDVFPDEVWDTFEAVCGGGVKLMQLVTLNSLHIVKGATND